MMLRRRLLEVLATMPEKVKTGSFTIDTDTLIYQLMLDFETSQIDTMIIHIQTSDLSLIPVNTTKDILTICDPLYLYTDYASVHPYQSMTMFKNSNGNDQASVFGRGAFSTGPSLINPNMWIIRTALPTIYLRAGLTYKWTAILK